VGTGEVTSAREELQQIVRHAAGGNWYPSLFSASAQPLQPETQRLREAAGCPQMAMVWDMPCTQQR